MTRALLEVHDLKKYFPVKGGLFNRTIAQVKAVDGVSFKVESGRTLGLVGESGCGKSTLGRAILRLHEPTSGSVYFDGEDLLALSRTQMKAKRSAMQIIFQDPYASLSPRMTVHELLREPLDTHRLGDRAQRDKKVSSLLDVVGLSRQALNRYPHEFSGGQRQRIGIARALSLDPKFIVADEPVSALDVSVQSQVLNLISRLQAEFGLAFVFIAHDLAVVQHVSHDVGVMYLGRIVELTSSERLYRDPKHPYTQALMSAIPVPDPDRKVVAQQAAGDVPSPVDPPAGCHFHTRCPFAFEKCKHVTPEPVDIGAPGSPHLVRCHLYSDPA